MSNINDFVIENGALKKKGNSYHHYGGFSNIAMSICMGLAAYHFLSEKTEMTREFNRDKWESQGDYCSAEKVAFRISTRDNGGKVFVRQHDPYDNFG